MVTESPPRTHRAEFLESDRIKTIDVPQDQHLPLIAESIEPAMKSDKAPELRRACSEFFKHLSGFYKVSELRGSRTRRQTTARSRELEYGALRGLQPRHDADPGVEADSRTEGNHILRHVLEHPMSRILPSPRF